MGKNNHEDDLPENDEDLDDDEDDEDEDYEDFSLDRLDKEAIKNSGKIMIEESKIGDFASLVSWAEEHDASLVLENCMVYGTRIKGNPIDISLDDVSCTESFDCPGERFTGRLCFDDVGFGKRVDFSTAVFDQAVSFEDCSFYGPVNFANCRFKDDVSFRDSEFEDECTFDGTIFQGPVNLTSATFEKMVSFKDAVFESSVNLRRVDFAAGVDKTGSNIDNPMGEDSSDDDGAENVIETESKRTQPGISLCMIVKNELENLKKNLSPLFNEFPEIVVVDTGSDDGTREYLDTLSPHVKILDFIWLDDFSAARNEYLKAATCDWIYWMDADEYLDPEYVSILKECSKSGWDTAWSYKYGDWASESHIKLFPNIENLEYEMRCHEQIRPSLIKAGIRRFQFLPSQFRIDNPSYDKIPEESRHRNIRLLKLDIEERPDYIMSYVYLAYIYTEFAAYDDALESLDKCLSLNTPASSLDVHGRKSAMHAKKIITLQKAFHEKANRGEDLTKEELQSLAKLARQDPY
ncbi:MAG: pentapeptide repeat-containing protein [Planctomycetota bacterium]